MVLLAVVLLVLGYVLYIPALMTIGWILLLVGLVLWVFDAMGHPVGGRRWW